MSDDDDSERNLERVGTTSRSGRTSGRGEDDK